MKTATLDQLEEVVAEKRQEPGADPDHLACGCRPHMCLCGSYIPEATQVFWVDEDDNICKPCLQVWNGAGCGACGCRKGNECRVCKQARPY